MKRQWISPKSEVGKLFLQLFTPLITNVEKILVISTEYIMHVSTDRLYVNTQPHTQTSQGFNSVNKLRILLKHYKSFHIIPSSDESLHAQHAPRVKCKKRKER